MLRDVCRRCVRIWFVFVVVVVYVRQATDTFKMCLNNSNTCSVYSVLFNRLRCVCSIIQPDSDHILTQVRYVHEKHFDSPTTAGDQLLVGRPGALEDVLVTGWEWIGEGASSILSAIVRSARTSTYNQPLYTGDRSSVILRSARLRADDRVCLDDRMISSMSR